jgi:N-methylhydantoinase A
MSASRGADGAVGWRLGVDIGGTFTDLVAEGAGRRHTAKLLTTHGAPEEAVLDGVRTMLAEARLRPSEFDATIHGTTLATNALIERHS